MRSLTIIEIGLDTGPDNQDGDSRRKRTTSPPLGGWVLWKHCEKTPGHPEWLALIRSVRDGERDKRTRAVVGTALGLGVMLPY